MEAAQAEKTSEAEPNSAATSEIQQKIQEAEQMRQSLMSREGHRRTQKSNPIVDPLRQEEPFLREQDTDLNINNSTPKNLIYSNNSPHASSFVKQSSLKQSSVGSLPGVMQWNTKVEKQRAKADIQAKMLHKQNTANTMRSSQNSNKFSL